MRSDRDNRDDRSDKQHLQAWLAGFPEPPPESAGPLVREWWALSLNKDGEPSIVPRPPDDWHER